jgi:glycogen debranching enzyme
LITLVSKWMGSLDNWERYFEIVRKLGYNMIHFTPLQQRGTSNSPYSIKDQLKLSDDIFKGEQELEIILKLMNEKYEIAGMTDIVWNHTACDSDWLTNHPEAGYNLENSPHLKAAFDLDESILSFSSVLRTNYGISGELRNENDLLEMMKVFKDKHLPKARLWEYFVINVSQSERQLDEFIEISLDDLILKTRIAIKDLKEAEENDGKWGRFSIKMNLNAVISFYSNQIEEIRSCDHSHRNQLISLLLADYRSKLDHINLEKYQKYDEIIDIACRNVFNRALYERIAENGPKLGSVTERY